MLAKNHKYDNSKFSFLKSLEEKKNSKNNITKKEINLESETNEISDIISKKLLDTVKKKLVL